MTAGRRIELRVGEHPGEFTVSLDGLAITIHLPESGRTREAEGPGKGTAGASLPERGSITGESAGEQAEIRNLSREVELYQQWVREIYEGLGKLAKDINVSIQDLSLAELIQSSMGSPGEHLDQARSQVTDVLMMTEQATLNIMDLVEEIREDCLTVQKKLLSLTAGEEAAPALAPPAEGLTKKEEELWRKVLEQAGELDRLLQASPPPGPSAAGPPLFSLNDILQIILEYCTNEKVKQHLKAVQNRQEAVFAVPEIEQALSLMATGAPQEDGFYQLPVAAILDILVSHCREERVKELLVKMASSADKLYPVPNLPLEIKEGAEDFASEAEAPGENSGLGTQWEELRQNLYSLFELRHQAPPAAEATGAGVPDLRAVLDTVDHITKNLSRIIEALSFQDLSGQRLLKLLKILRQLQVQVLTLLVAAGERLQGQLDAQALGVSESSQAREELDRLLTRISPASDDKGDKFPSDQPLDQNAINELLTSMGF